MSSKQHKDKKRDSVYNEHMRVLSKIILCLLQDGCNHERRPGTMNSKKRGAAGRIEIGLLMCSLLLRRLGTLLPLAATRAESCRRPLLS